MSLGSLNCFYFFLFAVFLFSFNWLNPSINYFWNMAGNISFSCGSCCRVKSLAVPKIENNCRRPHCLIGLSSIQHIKILLRQPLGMDTPVHFMPILHLFIHYLFTPLAHPMPEMCMTPIPVAFNKSLKTWKFSWSWSLQLTLWFSWTWLW